MELGITKTVLKNNQISTQTHTYIQNKNKEPHENNKNGLYLHLQDVIKKLTTKLFKDTHTDTAYITFSTVEHII
jgi:hypothetical protein